MPNIRSFNYQNFIIFIPDMKLLRQTLSDISNPAAKYPKNNITRDVTVLKEIVKSSKIEDLAKNSDIHRRR